MIVVDTNIICYFFINGEFSDIAEKTFQKDSHWIAPLLWRSEFRNVLALCIRKNILTLEDAITIMTEAELLMKGNEYSVDSSDILRLVAQSNCSTYDCEFVALAQELGVPLVTMDKKILTSFPKVAIKADIFIAK